MAITPAQLSAALRVKKEFNLITGAGVLTDLTNWLGLGIIAPDSAAVLLKLIDPTGSTVYINAGYDTDSYAAPDFTLVTTTKNFAIPSDVNSEYITGTYTLYIKAQVVDDGDTVTTASAVETTAVVCDCTATVSIEVDTDYATAMLTTTDTTSYGAYSSITRTHTIYPPPLSGLPNQATGATTNVYTNIVTTMWSVGIVSDVTYLNASDTYTTCRLTGSKEFVVEADTLCETLCLLKKFRTGELYSRFGKKCTEDIERAWNLAIDEYVLAMNAIRCGRPQSEVDTHIDKIYELTGLDPNCDCGCTSDYPTPVVPTSIINGTDGADGVTPQFQNTGVWIQVSTDNGVTWDNLFSLAAVTGAAGAAGTNGTDGADGTAVLANQYPNLSTLGVAFESLAEGRTPYILSANTLNTNLDDITIRAVFTTNGAGTTPKVRVAFNGSTMNGNAQFGGGVAKIVFDIRLSRITNTTAKYETRVTKYTIGLFTANLYDMAEEDVVSIAGLDFTANPYNIDVQGDSDVIGDVTCAVFNVNYGHKS